MASKSSSASSGISYEENAQRGEEHPPQKKRKTAAHNGHSNSSNASELMCGVEHVDQKMPFSLGPNSQSALSSMTSMVMEQQKLLSQELKPPPPAHYNPNGEGFPPVSAGSYALHSFGAPVGAPTSGNLGSMGGSADPANDYARLSAPAVANDPSTNGTSPYYPYPGSSAFSVNYNASASQQSVAQQQFQLYHQQASSSSPESEHYTPYSKMDIYIIHSLFRLRRQHGHEPPDTNHRGQ